MMLRIFTTTLLAITASALAVIAQPAPAEAAPKPAPLIGSELNMHDLLFLAHALDLGKSLTYLAEQTARTNNPNLKGYGDNLVKTLAAQSAVLATVAEMRNIKAPAESPTQKKLSDKIGKLEGAKLQKAILDAFIEVDERFIATYELGAHSADATISKFVEQTLPEARKHLLVVQRMAGIAPQYVERTESPTPALAETAAPAKPVVEAAKPTAPAVTTPPAKPAIATAPASHIVMAPPAPQPAKPEPKPTAIAEPPEDIAPMKLEAAPSKPTRPSFRTNIPLQN